VFVSVCRCGGCLGCVPVQMCLCSGTDGAMFRYMPRAGYRSGEKRVDVWLSSVQHAHLSRLAEAEGCSLGDMVGLLVREKVMRDGDGDAGRGFGGAAEAARSGSRHPALRGGAGDPRVVSHHVADAVVAPLSEQHEAVYAVNAEVNAPLGNLLPPSIHNVPPWAAEALGLSEPGVVRHLSLVESSVPMESEIARSMVDEFIDLP
jgi:hypothetical protein